MAADIRKKLDDVLEKLRKLDVIENRLNNLHTAVANIEGAISNLDKDVADFKAKSQSTNAAVSKLEESVNFNDGEITDLKRDLLDLKSENESLKKPLLYFESYSRRENLKLIGIAENSNNPGNNQSSAESSDSLQSENNKEVLFKFFEEELNIDNARKMVEFQRVHRLGKPRSLSSDPRPIIARSLRYQDREEVTQQARANLKD